MRDAEIRTALHAFLRREHREQPDTRFVDELGLCGIVRVDVAVINGTFAGFELKSDHDTLRRLPAQVETYSKVLDLATLVVGERFATTAACRAIVPEWWGVIVARPSAGGVELEELRTARWNEQVEASHLVQLLWREEALGELAARGLDGGVRTKPRRVIFQRLAHEVPVGELRDCVRAKLKTREGWPRPLPRE